MWQIILQILAIIGIVLLAVIGIILLLLILVLFIPIRYKVIADIDTLSNKYNVLAKASWFLKIISLKVGYPVDGKLTLKLFGITIKVIDFNESETEENSAETDTETATDTDTDSVDIVSDDNAKHVNEEENQDFESNQMETVSNKQSSESVVNRENNPDRTKTIATEKEPKEIKQKWYEKILYTWKSLCDKIKGIWNNIHYYIDLLNRKENRLFFDKSKKRIAKLLKGIAPKRCKGLLRVGTGSPDTTGYLLAVYGMLVPYLDKELFLEPDFEEAICQGSAQLKGRVYLITILVCVLSFLLDKQLFILLEKLKREEK